MSCTWKIRLSPNENQEIQIQKKMKKMKNYNFFSCKDSLFSLGNYVWDEKFPFFNHPVIDIEKLSIVTSFEPDKFLFISRPRITFHIGGQKRREISYRAISDQMPDVGRQIWEKMEFQKLLSSPLREIWVSKSKAKMLKKEPKKCRRKMIWKKKTGWNENEEKQGKKTKAELVPHKNDPWFNYLETQFGPTYLFFRNPEPKPTLRAVKVHFDWTWILRLKRFFLRKFSSKIISIHHPPIWDEFWIFECIIRQPKKNKKKWL